MRLCVIKVSGFSYMARFPSTCAALADALMRFPRATTVSVQTGAAVGAVKSGDAGQRLLA